jgi:hypothetical protein
MSDDPKQQPPVEPDANENEPEVEVTVHPEETITVPPVDPNAPAPEDPGEHLPNPAERRKLDQAPENR